MKFLFQSIELEILYVFPSVFLMIPIEFNLIVEIPPNIIFLGSQRNFISGKIKGSEPSFSGKSDEK